MKRHIMTVQFAKRLQHYVGPKLIIYFSWHSNDQTLKLLHIWYIDVHDDRGFPGDNL
jgi:hypothetical protein